MTLLGLLLAASLASDPVQAPPVFSAATESVYLDVFVTHEGEPVRGLAADDFEVLDGGRRVAVEMVPTDAVPLAAVLILDTSVSVAGPRLERLRAACDTFVSGLGPQDEPVLITFSNAVRLRARAGGDRLALRRALLETQPGGRTALFDALFAGLLLAPSLPGRSTLVVFSDGHDTVSWLGGTDVLGLARRSSTLVYAVGVASDLLRQVTEITGGRTLPETGNGVEAAFLRVLSDLRTRYLLRFDPADRSPGWHPVAVRLKRARGDLRHRPGYERRPSP